MLRVIADSSLSDNEKEDRSVENLIDKKTPHSRKYKTKRGPKYDNRKRRITEDDPDLNSHTVEGDRDMSLNYKNSSDSSIALIAIKIAGKESESAYNAMLRVRDSYKDTLLDSSLAVAKDFAINFSDDHLGEEDGTKDGYDRISNSLKESKSSHLKARSSLKSQFKKADPKSVSSIVAENWPNGDTKSYGARAAVIGALGAVIWSSSLPDILKIPLMREDASSVVNDPKYIEKLISEASKKGHTFKEVDINRFIYLAAAHRIVSKNPVNLDKTDIDSGIKEISINISEQVKEMQEVESLIKQWVAAVSQFKKQDYKEIDYGASSKSYDQVLDSLGGFFKNEKKVVVDLDQYRKHLEEYAEAKLGKIPSELSSVLRAATSNEAYSIRNMRSKVSAYHGVIQQRPTPDSTNTGYKSYDSRYFTKDHYDSIVKTAKEIMDDGWFLSGWDGGSPDAPVRAALDMSIQTADGGLYQSKIDTETYNLLLNKLANWGHDTFSDTILPYKNDGSRSASVKNLNNTALIVANSIRGTHPREAISLVKAYSKARTASQEEIVFQSLSDDEFDKLKKEMESIMDFQKIQKDGTLDSFVEGLDAAFEIMQKKTAGVISSFTQRLIRASFSRLASTVRAAELNPQMVEKWISELTKDVQEVFKEEDFDKFLEGLQDIQEEVQQRVSSLTYIPTTAVYAMVGNHVDLGRVMGEQLNAHMAASKKKSKKDDTIVTSLKEKKEDKKKEDKPSDKKPPVSKKDGKGKPPAKKDDKKGRKASFTPSDLDW